MRPDAAVVPDIAEIHRRVPDLRAVLWQQTAGVVADGRAQERVVNDNIAGAAEQAQLDVAHTPGEEIFNFPGESGLPFIFDVEEELTGDPAAMDAVGEMLDEAEKLAETAKAAIKAALADEDSRYHSVVTFFMEFHRDDVGPDIAAELFPGTDPSKLSFAEMVDFLKLKRFGSLVDDEMDQQVFILDLSFNPEITDELMVTYFDLNKEIFCITHES